MELALSPCMIGTCRIENRIVMTAANLGYCRDGYVTEELTAFYRERAGGGIGLIIAGAAGVDPERVNRTGMMQICDDSYIEPLLGLTGAVHQAGSKIFLQLMHAGAYAKQSEHRGRPAVAPSSYVCPFTRETTSELTGPETGEIVSYFAKAASRARAAGFDGIELIGSAGYLISEFLSAATNRRRDRYGGSPSHRTRFLREILEAIRKRAGEDFPVLVRLSGRDFIQGGNTAADFLEIGTALEPWVDGINVTGGWHETQVPQITYHVPKGMYLYLSRALKEKVSIPVIGCNRQDIFTAVRSVERGDCDMAGMLRPLIADPNLVAKYIEGKSEMIRPCLACNQQCMDRIFSGQRMECTVNYRAGREGETFIPRDAGKNILVIGAGISGLVYASLAAGNNRVTVWEKEITCGGTGRVIGRLPDRGEVLTYLRYLFGRCVTEGVVFQWLTEGTETNIRQQLSEGLFDKVVLAAGSAMSPCGYRVEDGAAVRTPEECIMMEHLPGRKIAVIGSGYKALQTARYCATAGKEGDLQRDFLERFVPEDLDFASGIMGWGETSVTLLSPDVRAGGGLGKSTRWTALKDLEQRAVTVISGIEIRQIRKDGVVYDRDGREEFTAADLVVVGEGWQSNRELITEPEEWKDKVLVIGDARRPGRISEAVRDAFMAAMK